MNRRILHIDSDSKFAQSLVTAFAPYGIEVVRDENADQAVAYAAGNEVALIVIAVEEPDKSGFKVFQRCKKAPLSKIPVMLVTSSLSADSFAKHQNLKTHADAYLDKRDFSHAELVNKVDALIALGEPIHPVASGDDDLDIPVEVDEVPLADDDMVLDEAVEVEEADEPGEFGAPQPHRLESHHSQPSMAAVDVGAISASLEDELDDAFGGLLGDEAPAPSMDAVVEAAVENDATPVPMDEPIPQVRRAPPGVALHDVDAIPHPVGGHEEPPPPPPRGSELSLDDALSAPIEIADDDAAPQPMEDQTVAAESEDFDSFSREYSAGDAAPLHLGSQEMGLADVVAPDPAMQQMNQLPVEDLDASLEDEVAADELPMEIEEPDQSLDQALDQPLEEHVEQHLEAPVEQVEAAPEEVAASPMLESSPAIAIDEDDLQVFEDVPTRAPTGDEPALMPHGAAPAVPIMPAPEPAKKFIDTPTQPLIEPPSATPTRRTG
ncbi:MAG TPA: response regulator, partial [Kofleriaceae bacterium]